MNSGETNEPESHFLSRARIFAALADGQEIPEVLRRFHLTQEELLVLFEEVAKFYREQDGGFWRLFCDGASRGNPGPAGAGAILQDPLGVVQGQANRFLGKATNNVAEYEALLLGLDMAAGRGIRKLKVFADSQLLVEQLKGAYQVKSPNLRPLWQKAREILEKFEAYDLTHIGRELNSEADRLANQAIDHHPESR